jgi:GTPase-associated protein 1, N-terminal domain type 1
MVGARKVMKVDCATYGATGNAHGLIESSLPRDRLPAELAGMVDKPPHHPEDALPLLACAPVGPFFAVWRTLDDREAVRHGMVRSYVALIELPSIGKLNSLSEVLRRLPLSISEKPFREAFEVDDAASTTPVLGPRYANLCELLVKPNRSRPVIVPDEGDWIDLLVTLWSFLWPEAREALSCMHAVGPEAEPARDATVLVTPRSSVNKWTGYPVVDHSPASTDAGRVLHGNSSPAMKQLQREVGAMPHDLRILGLLERAARLLPSLESKAATIADLKALCELTLRLAPIPGIASSLKQRIVDCMGIALMAAPASDMLSLSNLDFSTGGIDPAPIARSLQAWVVRNLALSGPQDASLIAKRFADKRFASWWRESIRSGLSDLLPSASLAVWETVWGWSLHRPELLAELLNEIEIGDSAESVMAQACPRSLPAKVAEGVVALACAREWSRVHGAVAAGAFPARQAFQLQLDFPVRPRDGVGVLLDRIAQTDVVDLAVAFDDVDVRQRAADTIVATPGLLTGLDIANDAWRDIWGMALAGGLAPWEGVHDQVAVAQQLIDQVVSGTRVDPSFLIALSTDLPQLPRGIPPRFWTIVTEPVRTAFARALAKRWLLSIEVGAGDQPSPEIMDQLLDVFAGRIAERSFKVDSLPKILNLTNEPRFVQRFIDGPIVAIPEQTAREIGHRIETWQNSDLAKAVFKKWEQGWHDLQDILLECSRLFTFWQRLKLPWRRPPSNEDKHDLQIELRQICCILYPEGPPEYLWEDAGGKASALPLGNTGEDRWARAISAVCRGASGAPRLGKIVEIVIKAFPGGSTADPLRLILRRFGKR